MKKRPIIALLTDFGTADGYVAALKGVLLSTCPDAAVVDITHEVLRHDIRSAAFLLWSLYRVFPSGTVFLAVVDPGVGSARQLCATRAGDRFFVHPENGILDLVLSDEPKASSVTLGSPGTRRKGMSATFHGRDILAPAAAALARGTPMRALGKRWVLRRTEPTLRRIPGRSSGRHEGTILHIDHFGNMITNFRMERLPSAPMSATVRRRKIASVHAYYAQAPSRTPFLLLGSSGLVEISVRNGSAASSLGASVGDRVSLTIGGRA